MATTINDWLTFLNRSDALVGVPLLIAGAGLMLFGWRMWKGCVTLSFAIVGAAIGNVLADGTSFHWLGAGLGSLLFGAGSLYSASYAAVALGGFIGAGLCAHFLSAVELPVGAFWLCCSVAFLGAAAYAFINRRLLIVSVTAVQGAVLLLSGVAAFSTLSPPLYSAFRSMAGTSAVVLPFLLLVPTVMSCFYQASELQRHQFEM